MSEYKWAVVYLWSEQGVLQSEVWYDNILDVETAEGHRSYELKEDSSINPQNMQVIQYVA